MNFIAILAAAITLQLSPGLSEPVGGDGARVDAAVLVSTNATATATVAAVYDLPVLGTVEAVVTNFAETNGVNRCLAPGARLLLTGSEVTVFLK